MEIVSSPYSNRSYSQVNGKNTGADEAVGNWNFTLLPGLLLTQGNSCRAFSTESRYATTTRWQCLRPATTLEKNSWSMRSLDQDGKVLRYVLSLYCGRSTRMDLSSNTTRSLLIQHSIRRM
ncbi:uncharacterized protein FYN16_002282 [Cariama cristata]